MINININKLSIYLVLITFTISMVLVIMSSVKEYIAEGDGKFKLIYLPKSIFIALFSWVISLAIIYTGHDSSTYTEIVGVKQSKGLLGKVSYWSVVVFLLSLAFFVVRMLIFLAKTSLA